MACLRAGAISTSRSADVAGTRDPWWMTAMILIAFVAWGLSITPFSHAIIAPGNSGATTGILTALLGPGVALKVLNRK